MMIFYNNNFNKILGIRVSIFFFTKIIQIKYINNSNTINAQFQP